MHNHNGNSSEKSKLYNQIRKYSEKRKWKNHTQQKKFD